MPRKTGSHSRKLVENRLTKIIRRADPELGINNKFGTPEAPEDGTAADHAEYADLPPPVWERTRGGKVTPPSSPATPGTDTLGRSAPRHTTIILETTYDID